MTTTTNKHIYNMELLLPAGSLDSAKAAIQNGANAIYLGGKDFSARQNAQNFSDEELKDIILYSHLRGVKVYRTLNTLIFDTEINELVKAIKTSAEYGIDAFIVEDLGVLALVKEICPEVRIHASTQLTVHTLNGALKLKEMGAKRVVLARELSKDEIKYISKNCGIETEVFVHGALCMSVSGQCYVSGIIGGRSGNRGQCAGTCRLPFTVNNSILKNDYALSLKDNCLIDRVKELNEMGVTSLKVEGRMKRPEYVAACGEAYSKALNNEEYDIDTLQAVFSRSGFTSGYYDNMINGDMFGIRRKEDVTATTNKLLKALEQTYSKEHPFVELTMNMIVKKGEPVSLMVSDGVSAVTIIDDIPQKAVNRAITQEDILKNLLKLGGTYYFCNNYTVTVDDGLFLAASSINEIRRKALEELDKKREAYLTNKNSILYNPDLSVLDKKQPLSVKQTTFHARFNTLQQIPFEIINMFEYFSLPLKEILKNKAFLLPYKDKLIIEPDRVMFGNEDKTVSDLQELKQSGFNKLYCLNIAHVKIGTDLSFILFGTAFLNCTNSISLDSLNKMDIHNQELSFELNINDAKRITKPDNTKLGIIVYGYLPLMIYRNCPVKAKIGCEKCNGNGSLTDRLGKSFNVICRHNGYSELLNTDLLYMGDRQHEITFADFITLYFTKESKESVKQVVTLFINSEKLNGEYTRGLYYRNI